MWSSETRRTFALASVKPLTGMFAYRDSCLDATKAVLKQGILRRSTSPLTGIRLGLFGEVDGLAYLRCPDTGSLFLADVAPAELWSGLLKKTNELRRSPRAFHSGIAESRVENVHRPKLEWIQSTLVLQQIRHPSLIEVTTTPSEFLPMLEESGIFQHCASIDETDLANGRAGLSQAEVLVMPESLDRTHDPKGLLKSAAECLMPGGLIFVTSLVSSGFDMAVLGT